MQRDTDQSTHILLKVEFNAIFLNGNLSLSPLDVTSLVGVVV